MSAMFLAEVIQWTKFSQVELYYILTLTLSLKIRMSSEFKKKLFVAMFLLLRGPQICD